MRDFAVENIFVPSKDSSEGGEKYDIVDVFWRLAKSSIARTLAGDPVRLAVDFVA
jgi:hypothetical protein